jgi:hypothetical protein
VALPSGEHCGLGDTATLQRSGTAMTKTKDDTHLEFKIVAEADPLNIFIEVEDVGRIAKREKYYTAIKVPKEHTDAVDAVIEKLKAQLESENKISR